MTEIKAGKSFLFAPNEESADVLNNYINQTGLNKTAAVRALICGDLRFGPVAEKVIAEEMKKGKTRMEAIEESILMRMKTEIITTTKKQIGKAPPHVSKATRT